MSMFIVCRAIWMTLGAPYVMLAIKLSIRLLLVVPTPHDVLILTRAGKHLSDLH
jgi:hypothetical protein